MMSADNDILVKIYEGQEKIILRLDALESGQRVIVQRLDTLESEQAAMKTELKAQREELASQRTELKTFRAEFTEYKTESGREYNSLLFEQRLLREKAEMLQTSTNWVLGAIAVFATVLGALPAIREWVKKSDDKPSRSELKDLMREVVREMLPELKR